MVAGDHSRDLLRKSPADTFFYRHHIRLSEHSGLTRLPRGGAAMTHTASFFVISPLESLRNPFQMSRDDKMLTVTGATWFKGPLCDNSRRSTGHVG